MFCKKYSNDFAVILDIIFEIFLQNPYSFVYLSAVQLKAESSRWLDWMQAENALHHTNPKAS